MASPDARVSIGAPDYSWDHDDVPSGEDSESTLMEAEPTGAGPMTIEYYEDFHFGPGVEASRLMAEMDVQEVAYFADRFEVAAEKFDMDPAILAGIASRESRVGKWLEDDGSAENGQVFGIMQLDPDWHDIQPIGDDFGSQAHINQAAESWDEFFDLAGERNPEWSDATRILAASSAYHGGPDIVDLPPDQFDRDTHDHDYGNDVVARAQYFHEHWYDITS